MARSSSSGAASVEAIGLTALVALLFIIAVAGPIAGGRIEAGRDLASALGRKLRCAPRLPGPCWRDPLTSAYGRGVAGLVRAWAPEPASRDGLVPVDFRRCRSASCAVPADDRLTTSNRRIAVFSQVAGQRRTGGGVRVVYWLYRPTVGWERVVRRGTSADVAANAKTPLLEIDTPRVIPLETLPGANHYRFRPSEEPPWRWKVGRGGDGSPWPATPLS